MKRKTNGLSLLLGMLMAMSAIADESVNITSWNVEHLGSSGRGFGGGFGGGNLPLRTDDQLNDIGVFIGTTLRPDVLALQEVSITSVDEDGHSISKQLALIVESAGSNWKYYLPPKGPDHTVNSMYVGFMWNNDVVKGVSFAPMDLPQDLELAGKDLFDRIPVVGYFEARNGSKTTNDFALVNVHMASGKGHDENHLIAMTLIEFELNKQLKNMGVKESDRIILGDFNDNPYELTKSGSKAKYSGALYEHMEFKGYKDYVVEGFHATRMDSALRSVIDHVLVNSSAQKHLVAGQDQAAIYLPEGGEASFAQWRKTYSDHFPVSIQLKVSGSDDDVD